MDQTDKLSVSPLQDEKAFQGQNITSMVVKTIHDMEGGERFLCLRAVFVGVRTFKRGSRTATTQSTKKKKYFEPQINLSLCGP